MYIYIYIVTSRFNFSQLLPCQAVDTSDGGMRSWAGAVVVGQPPRCSCCGALAGDLWLISKSGNISLLDTLTYGQHPVILTNIIALQYGICTAITLRRAMYIVCHLRL